MGKVSKVNVAAAKAQKEILIRAGKPVPRRIELIASYESAATLSTKVERVSSEPAREERQPPRSSTMRNPSTQ